MKLLDIIARVTQYVTEGVARIFRPTKDDYPETGVQPYTGDPPEDTTWG